MLEIGTLVRVRATVEPADLADYGVPGAQWVVASMVPPAAEAGNVCVTTALVRVPAHPPRFVAVVVTTDLLASVPLCYFSVVPAALWAQLAAAMRGPAPPARHPLAGVGIDDVFLNLPPHGDAGDVLAHLGACLQAPPSAVLPMMSDADADTVAAVFARAPLRGANRVAGAQPPCPYRLARLLWCSSATRDDRRRVRDLLHAPSNPCHQHAFASVCARVWPHHARVACLTGTGDAVSTLRAALALPMWRDAIAVADSQ